MNHLPHPPHPPHPPPALLAYHVPPPSRRPAGVLVLAILGLVIAGLGTLACLVSIGAACASLLDISAAMPRVIAVPALVINMVSLAFWLMLARASVAALRMRPWARRGMVRWAAIYLMWVVVGGVASCTVVLRLELVGVPAQFVDESRKQAYARAAMTAGVQALYPVAVILYMARRKVVAAFQEPVDAAIAMHGAQPVVPVQVVPLPVEGAPAAFRPARGAER